MTEQIQLAGYSLKEWSLIILLFILGIAVAAFVVAFAFAMMNNPDITISGTIDLSQFTGIVIGIAIVAITLVAQQLTAKNQASAVAQTDNAWLADK